MNKKIIALTAAAALATGMSAAADGDITVSVDGVNVVFADQAPVIDNDRTLVPMRAIFEALGAEVSWDGETRTVTSTKAITPTHNKTIKLTIDSADMHIRDAAGDMVEDTVVTLDVPAKIINDRTMVPVRAISEAMACKVDWDGEARAVIITTGSASTGTTTSGTTTPSAPEATAAPSQGGNDGSSSGGSVSVSKLPQAKPQEGVNTYVPDLSVGQIDPATGEIIEDANCTTINYAPVNGGKQYFAAVYHPNVHQYTNLINSYAFYDSNKKFISGGTDDMSKLVTAPDNAAYIRYTIDAVISSRHMLYVNFMETSTAPTEFTKSEAVLKEAKTDKLADKSIYIVGDTLLNSGNEWTVPLDKGLNAKKLYTNGNDGLRYTAQTGIALAADSFVSGLPKSGYDIVITSAGTYDWMVNMPVADFEKAVEAYITKAKKQFSNAELYLMTLPTGKYPGGFADGITNNVGKTPADYTEIIKKVGEAQGVGVIDIASLWTNDEVEKYMKNTAGDSYLFVNEDGGKLVSNAIIDALTK